MELIYKFIFIFLAMLPHLDKKVWLNGSYQTKDYILDQKYQILKTRKNWLSVFHLHKDDIFVDVFSLVNADFRIVGGISLNDNEYLPYQVSMQLIRRNGDLEHFCGGSIISPRSVLTAAHCVYRHNPKILHVVAGLHDLNDTRGQRSQVESFEFHKDYKEFVSNDIAIVYVDPPFKLDGIKVDKIDASSTQKIGGGVKLMLSGWGALSEDGDSYPMRLQLLSYRTITNEECKKTMKGLTDAELCARVRAKGSCGGDSGGPLVMKDGNNFRQVGIVSYGTLRCASDYPDVYTRISTYVNWIKERTK